jgi:hypothetical protein
LIYGPHSLQTKIRDRFPEATFEDASDCVHEDRFEVEIPDTNPADFYEFAIEGAFSTLCLQFELVLKLSTDDTIPEWMDELTERLKAKRAESAETP